MACGSSGKANRLCGFDAVMGAGGTAGDSSKSEVVSRKSSARGVNVSVVVGSTVAVLLPEPKRRERKDIMNVFL